MNNCNKSYSRGRWRFVTLALTLTTLAAVLSCCSDVRREPEDKPAAQELKVLYADRESFYRDYGNFIMLRLPDIQFKVIPTASLYGGDRPANEVLTELITERRPDLMFLLPHQQRLLQQRRELLPLDGLLDEDTLANVPANVKALLASDREGDSGLYGVPTSFNTELLLYNKDLFANSGIPLPSGGMSWQSFIDLARRFAGSTAAGFYSMGSGPASLTLKVGSSEGLAYVNKERTAMTFDTAGWAKVVEKIKPLYEDGVVLEASGALFDDPFLDGKAAMTIRGVDYYRQLERTNVPFKWGVAPAPGGDPSRIPLDLMEVMAISRDSVNAEAAAAVIQFIMNDSLNVLEKSIKSALPATLASPISQDPEHPLHFMYTQSANPNFRLNEERLQGLSESFLRDYTAFLMDQMQKIVDGQLDVREGLHSIEEYSNALLGSERSKGG